MTSAKDEAATRAGLAALPTAGELQRIAAQKEVAKAEEAMRHLDDAAEHKKHLIEQLTDLRVTEKNIQNFIVRAKRHAEAGDHEVMVLRFPNELCTDRGRAINNSEPDWPETLTGFPRDVYEKWNIGMRDLGYHLSAKILEFPGGMLGDVGMFISWN